MRIAHVLAGVDEPSAGPSHSVPALCRAMAGQGAEVELHSVAGWRGQPRADLAFPAVRHPQDFAAVPGLGALCLSSELDRTLRQADPPFAVIHTHGLWLAPNLYPAWAARRTGASVVLSPRGMLGEAALKFSGARKAVVWRLLQGPAVRAATCLHATGDSEAEEIRAAGLTNPIAVIPNGVDLPAPAAPARSDPPRTVLALGRVHPKKGLDRLVRAWAEVEPLFPDWRLRIVGPSELGHAAELAGLARELGLTRISIEDAVTGPAKDNAYAEAGLFVLPTLNENFAMTVAEALAAGVPVISTKGAPWSGLEREGCGWWVDHGPAPLAEALRVALSMPDTALAAMGARGRDWMRRDFSWARVAEDMLEVYAWLTTGGEPPAPIQISNTR